MVGLGPGVILVENLKPGVVHGLRLNVIDRIWECLFSELEVAPVAIHVVKKLQSARAGRFDILINCCHIFGEAVHGEGTLGGQSGFTHDTGRKIHREVPHLSRRGVPMR
jgi:hypothetical protein